MNNNAYMLHDGVAVLSLDRPPINNLSFELRTHLLQALDAANADPAVEAIVLHGNDKVFSGGVDINEFGSDLATRSPSLPELIRAVENSRKPVVAALGDLCLGGGLELALGCHYRVFSASARIGLPEVTLGLLPGAGGTQLLPRAIGLDAALNLILSGRQQAAADFRDTALVDELATEDLRAAAVDFARRLSADTVPWPRLRDRPLRVEVEDELYIHFVRDRLKGQKGQGPAPLAALEAVAAAGRLPVDEGLEEEGRLFAGLHAGPQSRALCHAFLAERAAGKIPGIDDSTPTIPVERVGVVGAGTMGTGIAIVFLNAGFEVALLESGEQALERGLAVVREHFAGLLAKKRLDQAQCDALLGKLSGSLDYAALGDVQLAVEAVFEDLEVKRQVLRRLDEALPDGAILASNTSTLDLNLLAEATSRPESVVGLHFFSPAQVMRLLEVVRGRRTADSVMATAMRLGKRLQKVSVASGVCDGFIGNRMLNEYLRVAGLLLDAGALPWQIDRALETWGMAMGPFRMCDMAGNDIGWAIRKRQRAADPGLRFSATADLLCEQGRFGQKTGKGWYRYEAGRRGGTPDPEVERLIDAYRTRAGLLPRTIGDREIVERCIYALVNEGARLLEEGIALRASDVDVVYLAGYGFPRLRGGPMHYAEEQGLANVVRRMREFACEEGGDARFWTPAPLLVRLAEHDLGFGRAGELQ
ncbi:3-hydroxyacyl-CoA dehydrogenase NAD-binding domain-containing protein [Azotobacter vinelandii DJ]|nr:3-hydroxyacyl-CoA dehydrogenase NAD-binding domain-containing protein [Azotobacter vinelandii]GLK61395.1 fatty acid degradation protein [Azotobacter vinelandii]SFX99857.1 short chain enoyl-CoA hydratase /3-hydroxyacyl-CoA dehydrogenase [Azotobacter vinelandii]